VQSRGRLKRGLSAARKIAEPGRTMRELTALIRPVISTRASITAATSETHPRFYNYLAILEFPRSAGRLFEIPLLLILAPRFIVVILIVKSD